MIDVRRLRMLAEVAAAGSVSAAAANLNFTHSAVSQHLAKLERETGATLLERDGRGVRLTHAAQVLVEHGRDILARIEAAEAALAASDGTVAGQVRLASFATATQALLPAALKRLADEHPGVDLRLIDMEPADSLPALRRRAVDVALVFAYDLVPGEDDAGLHSEDLFSEKLLLVQRDGAAAQATGRLADFAERRWIVPPQGSTCGRLVRRACALAGFEPDVVAEAHDFVTAAALAREGVGVTLMPELGFRPQAGLLALPVTEPALTRRVWQVARAGSESHPAIAAVLRAIRDT